MNRLTQKSYPDSTTVNYTYDNDSRLTQVADATGNYSFTFDNMGRLIGTLTNYAFLTGRHLTTGYGYDAASNRTSFTDPENGSTSYVYDTLNRLQTLTPPVAYGGGSFGFGYDVLSRRTSLTRPNTVNTSYGYDNLSHLLSVTHVKGSTTLDGASYGVDSTGTRNSRTPLPGTTATNFTYDAIYELLTAKQGSTTKESYTYDPVGNRLTSLGVSSYTNNSSNELTAKTGVTYTYDSNGNTLTKVVGTNTTSYAWDYENRLTSVTLPGSGGTVSFKYDPFGRRVEKVSSSATSIYIYDGDNLIEETNAVGSAVARYTQTQNIDEPLAMLRGTTTDFYEADGLGSITSLTNSSGANAATYTYDSFGNLTASTGSLTNSFRYTSREFDTETNLYFYRARYYDQSTGRFLSEDPVQFLGGGTNFYAYARNNPANWTDPSGEIVWVPVVVAGIGAIAGGAVEGIKAHKCGRPLLPAIARGALSGAVGSVAGLYVAFTTGQPWLAGAAGSVAGTFTSDLLKGRLSSGTDYLVGAGAGAVLGVAAEGLGGTLRGGQNFNPFKSPRTFGPQAKLAYGKEGISQDLQIGTQVGVGLAKGNQCGCQE